MTDTTRPIVVGVDGSDAAMSAAIWAAAVALKFEVPLELVSGAPEAGHLLTDAAMAIRAAALAEHHEQAAALLKSTEEQVRAAAPGLEVTTLRSDEPADALLISRSRSARFVVLGAGAISPAAALLVGSTTLAVTAHSACPVVVWRGDSDVPTKKPIVLGVDGERTGAVAFETAFELASRFDVELRAVHAWPSVRPPAWVTEPLLTDWDGLESLEWAKLLNILEPWTARYPDVKVTNYIEPDGPAKVLLRHAADSQLVIVGSRKRTLLAATLVGSTGLNLLHHCPTPVVICH
ncbi:universal stress protein [Mycobacterium barrassiae]|uniref:universal stress protein n=1 Tax=Mycobacterium barrassiae TaxID=319709 RepID=UPI0022658C53|nr:universal stress protein [Mycobacterium barrassiae]MCV7300474.1 universal stress protein [Mycobacterium barrassiae]